MKDYIFFNDYNISNLSDDTLYRHTLNEDDLLSQVGPTDEERRQQEQERQQRRQERQQQTRSNNGQNNNNIPSKFNEMKFIAKYTKQTDFADITKILLKYNKDLKTEDIPSFNMEYFVSQKKDILTIIKTLKIFKSAVKQVTSLFNNQKDVVLPQSCQQALNTLYNLAIYNNYDEEKKKVLESILNNDADDENIINDIIKKQFNDDKKSAVDFLSQLIRDWNTEPQWTTAREDLKTFLFSK